MDVKQNFPKVVAEYLSEWITQIYGVHLGNYSIHGAFLAFLARSLAKQNPVPPPRVLQCKQEIAMQQQGLYTTGKRNKKHIYHMTIVYTHSQTLNKYGVYIPTFYLP